MMAETVRRDGLRTEVALLHGDVRCPYCNRKNGRRLNGDVILECKKCGREFLARSVEGGSSA